MASGIAINDKCTELFSALSKRQYGALILKITDGMDEVVVDNTAPPTSGDPKSEWGDLVKSMPDDGCRYVITDFSWKDNATVVKSKIVMLLWSSDNAPVREKMIYAASMENVTTKLSVQKTIQATEFDEIAYDVIKDQVAGK